MPELTERDKQLVAFLRNLSRGFSSHRLFDGDLAQPGFVEAVKRIEATAEPLVTGGLARVRIHGDRFFSESGPLPEDDSYKRLALACYERRVEEIAITSIPTKDDLAALYEILATATEDVEQAGGAPPLLASRGVRSIRLNEATMAATDLPSDVEGFSVDLDALDAGIERLDEMSQEWLRDRLSLDARSLYKVLREIVATLPPEKANDPDTYKRLREAVDKLPAEVRTSLSSMLLSDVGSEAVAERIIGTMTDTSLARMLVDVAREVGGDPIDLARELVVGGFRRHDLVDLAQAATSAPETGNGRGDLDGVGGDRSRLLDAVGELVAGDLREHADDDERSIRAEYPHTQEQQIDDSFATFADYLRVDDDTERLASVLESWSGATRSALSDDNVALAVRLLRAGDQAQRELRIEKPDRAKLISDAKATILNQELIADLMEQGSQEETGALVSLFGDRAVNALFQRLAAEEVGARRSMLIGILANIATEHRPIMRRWVKDDRWFVVRNVMTIVQRSGAAAELIDVMEIGMSNDHPAVRKEAARALATAGAPALSLLATLAADSDREVALAAADALGSGTLGETREGPAIIGRVVRTARDSEVRERALVLLAEHPSNTATEVLASIGKFGTRPRAPFGIRRKARALARQRGHR